MKKLFSAKVDRSSGYKRFLANGIVCHLGGEV